MDWYHFWVELLLPILAILIPVFSTIYTVNRRVENENKETHKPYLVFRRIQDLKKFNPYEYYLLLFGRNYKDKSTSEELFLQFTFRNIGYGVATNIKFYDLLTAEEIEGKQEFTKEENQKLFTTFDIASTEEKSVQAKLYTEGEDHKHVLCIYQDLNRHIYSFIFSINTKENNHYDFFAYQPSSRSYKKWIKENKKQYKRIVSAYKAL